MYDETLRLELSPLNVKVLTVVTGAIATNIQTNAPRPKLPLGTNYRNAEGYLDKLRMGKLDFTVTNPDVFAQKVVGDVLSGAIGRVHRGANSSVTHWASHFMPTWLMVWSHISSLRDDSRVRTNIYTGSHLGQWNGLGQGCCFIGSMIWMDKKALNRLSCGTRMILQKPKFFERRHLVLLLFILNTLCMNWLQT